MLAEIFNSLLLICGILLLLVIIISIISTPFEKIKKAKRKQELDKALNECLDVLITEIVKQSLTENKEAEKKDN